MEGWRHARSLLRNHKTTKKQKRTYGIGPATVFPSKARCGVVGISNRVDRRVPG